MDRADPPAVVDRVDGDVLGVEVGHVEQGIVGGDQAADGIVADHISAAHVIGAGDDLRDGVGERVEDEKFAAIGLEGQLDRRVAHVEQCLQSVGLGGNGLGWRGRMSFRMSQGEGHDLVAGRAGYKCFRGIGKDDGV